MKHQIKLAYLETEHRTENTTKYMARALSLPGSALLPARITLAWGLGWPYQTLVGPGIQWEVRGPCSVTLYLASASTELLLALPHLLISRPYPRPGPLPPTVFSSLHHHSFTLFQP